MEFHDFSRFSKTGYTLYRTKRTLLQKCKLNEGSFFYIRIISNKVQTILMQESATDNLDNCKIFDTNNISIKNFKEQKSKSLNSVMYSRNQVH